MSELLAELAACARAVVTTELPPWSRAPPGRGSERRLDVDVLDLDGVGQADAVRRGEVSPPELAQAALERLRRVDPALHAVVVTTEQVAAEQASAAVPGGGPLSGIPVVVKDLALRQRGVPVGLGVRALERQAVVAGDDTVTGRRLRQAGCVTVAVSSTSPFGFGPWAATAAGSTRTPYDVTRASNGSSGGSAALVAARAVALGTAADAGGSIRLPAAWCGLVGLKPSRGLVPVDLVEPVVTEGVVTRSVRDTAAALDVLAGPVPGDLFIGAGPAGNFLEALREEGLPQHGPPLRVGVIEDCPVETDAAVRRAVDETGCWLEELGHVVEAAQPPALFEQAPRPENGAVVLALLRLSVEQAGDLLGRPLEHDELEPYIRLMLGWGEHATAVDRLRRDAWVQDWSRRLLAWWERYDLLVLPTCPVLPQPAELWEPVPGSPEDVFARWGPSLVCVEPFNRSGQPAVTLPVSVEAGLPVGVQLVAAPGRDLLLLQVAAALETATGWLDRRPSVTR